MNLHYKQYIVPKIDPIQVELVIIVYKIEFNDFT